MIPWSKILYYLRLAWPRNKKRQEGRPRCFGNPRRETTMFWTNDTGTKKANMNWSWFGRKLHFFNWKWMKTLISFWWPAKPLCYDPAIQNIILKICLAQEQKKRQEGGRRCFGNPCRGPTNVFEPPPKTDNRATDLAQEHKNAKKGDHDVLETQEGGRRCFRNPCTSQRKQLQNQWFYSVLRTLCTKVWFSLGPYCKLVRARGPQHDQTR